MQGGHGDRDTDTGMISEQGENQNCPKRRRIVGQERGSAAGVQGCRRSWQCCVVLSTLRVLERGTLGWGSWNFISL